MRRVAECCLHCTVLEVRVVCCVAPADGLSPHIVLATVAPSFTAGYCCIAFSTGGELRGELCCCWLATLVAKHLVSYSELHCRLHCTVALSIMGYVGLPIGSHISCCGASGLRTCRSSLVGARLHILGRTSTSSTRFSPLQDHIRRHLVRKVSTFVPRGTCSHSAGGSGIAS